MATMTTTTDASGSEHEVEEEEEEAGRTTAIDKKSNAEDNTNTKGSALSKSQARLGQCPGQGAGDRSAETAKEEETGQEGATAIGQGRRNEEAGGGGDS